MTRSGRGQWRRQKAVRAATSPPITTHNRIKAIQNYVKKLKEESRRRRGPVVQAVAENVLRKQRSGRNQPGFGGRRLEAAEIGAGRHPSRSIFIEALPLGFGRSAVKGFYDVRLRNARSPKTSCDTECQRANGNSDQHTLPSSLTNLMMCQQLHVAVSASSVLRDYTTLDAMTQILPRFTDSPSSWIPDGKPVRAPAEWRGRGCG